MWHWSIESGRVRCFSLANHPLCVRQLFDNQNKTKDRFFNNKMPHTNIGDNKEYTPHIARIFQQSYTGWYKRCECVSIWEKNKETKKHILLFCLFFLNEQIDPGFSRHERFDLRGQSLGLSVGIFWPNKGRHQHGGQIHLCRRHSTFFSWWRSLPPSVPVSPSPSVHIPLSHPLFTLLFSAPIPALFGAARHSTNSVPPPVSACLPPNPPHNKTWPPECSRLPLKHCIVFYL